MRVLLIADIHANLVALEAVIEDAGPVDAVWCLGDVIGYGPRPNECSAWVEEHAAVTVVGNHDWACLGRLDLDEFNDAAHAATLWTIDRLTPHAHNWIDSLPNRYIEGDLTLAEGLTLNGVGAAGTTGSLENVSDTNIWTGPIKLASDSTIAIGPHIAPIMAGIIAAGGNDSGA